MPTKIKPTDHYYLGLSPEGFHRNYYRQWGDADNDNVIVCVHGLTRISRDFDTLAKELAQDYRVICPDIVGRGFSDWLGNRQNYNFPQYCSDMNALIGHLRVEKVHWLGTSMGGIIGLIISAMENTPIQSLILNDVGPEIKRSELQRLGRYIGRAPLFYSEEELFNYYKETYQAFGYLTDKQWQQMAIYCSFKEEDHYRLHYDPKLGDAFRSSYSFFNFDLWKYWEDINCPTMLVRGELSSFFPRELMESMLEKENTNHFIEVPNVGHTPTLTTEQEIKAIKDFYRAIHSI